MKKAVRVSEVTEQFTAEYQSETAVETKTEKTNKEETTMTRLTVKELREQAKRLYNELCKRKKYRRLVE